ncbi:hypothetical protein MPK70_gp302 [Erwinia phage pEa_SNUABM_33]|uniref:Uncharacterized protein n=1 Tax=Erwinia phage pEa_SNUABM_33 TaxID=2869556 RepID=A0AAE7XQ12_9CAUD|nr:hypothetical protein MPK70_gp302 [Erwinia phage pEa_SNUABM_33]QZE58178.1 hypothetical protein pEaSNUABM33_00302 [Erwinia phage pEa_SNUABM_33]
MDDLLIVLIAYYIVGVIIFIRDLYDAAEDTVLRKQFDAELEQTSNTGLAIELIRVVLFVVFIHIPCWIFRV